MAKGLVLDHFTWDKNLWDLEAVVLTVVQWCQMYTYDLTVGELGKPPSPSNSSTFPQQNTPTQTFLLASAVSSRPPRRMWQCTTCHICHLHMEGWGVRWLKAFGFEGEAVVGWQNLETCSFCQCSFPSGKALLSQELKSNRQEFTWRPGFSCGQWSRVTLRGRLSPSHLECCEETGKFSSCRSFPTSSCKPQLWGV